MPKFVVLLVLVISVLSSCATDPITTSSEVKLLTPDDGVILYWHDDARSVSCWIWNNFREGGISCLPDSQVVRRGR